MTRLAIPSFPEQTSHRQLSTKSNHPNITGSISRSPTKIAIMKVLPQNQLEHSLEVVQQLGKPYGITVEKYQEATSGIENTTLFITAASGQKYVFRIYRQGKKSNAQIQAEIDFMAYLHKHEIPTPLVVSDSSGITSTVIIKESCPPNCYPQLQKLRPVCTS